MFCSCYKKCCLNFPSVFNHFSTLCMKGFNLEKTLRFLDLPHLFVHVCRGGTSVRIFERSHSSVSYTCLQIATYASFPLRTYGSSHQRCSMKKSVLRCFLITPLDDCFLTYQVSSSSVLHYFNVFQYFTIITAEY